MKAGLLRFASLFVLTSHGEGLPSAALEAMWCKAPVLLSSLCNLPEVINYSAGLIVEPEITQIIKSLSIMLLMNKKQLEDMGANGFRLVNERYRWESVFSRTASLCESVIKMRQ
jgi:glycosyltransferase involved in cell wall biosynthesis